MTAPAVPHAWMTVNQFAQLIQLAPWTVRQHIRSQRIPATYVRNIGAAGARGRVYRISPKAVDAYRL